MLIKVCGMREADNIRAIEASGPDWMGFIFCPRSPRHVAECPPYLPSQSQRVGVFVNSEMASILQKQAEFELDYVQLHGNESADFCHQLRTLLPDHVRIIKMIPVATAADFAQIDTFSAHDIDFILLETKARPAQQTHYGGSGCQFDWSILQDYPSTIPFLLSGGITADDAPRILSIRHPKFAGVDINSGFETAPAHKDVERVRTFIHTLRVQSTQ